MKLLKTKQELSLVAKKAVLSTLYNRVNRLSEKNRDCLKVLVDAYNEAKYALDYLIDVPTIIFHEVAKTTKTSFVRNSDFNKLDRHISRNYISQTGTPLDVQAFYASHYYGIEITEQDFIDFMIDNPYGINYFKKNLVVEQIKAEIKSLIGFNATHTIIEKIYYKLNTHANTTDLYTPF